LIWNKSLKIGKSILVLRGSRESKRRRGKRVWSGRGGQSRERTSKGRRRVWRGEGRGGRGAKSEARGEEGRK
jgi:hypothetical protein